MSRPRLQMNSYLVTCLGSGLLVLALGIDLNGDGKKEIFVGFQGQYRALPDMKANLVFNFKDYEEQWYAF